MEIENKLKWWREKTDEILEKRRSKNQRNEVEKENRVRMQNDNF